MFRQPPITGQQSQRKKKLPDTTLATNAMRGMRQPNFGLTNFQTEPSHYVSFDATNLTSSTWPKNNYLYAPPPPDEPNLCSPTMSQCHLMQSLLPPLQQNKPTTSRKSTENKQIEPKELDSEAIQKELKELKQRLAVQELKKRTILRDIQKLKQRLGLNDLDTSERLDAGKWNQNSPLPNAYKASVSANAGQNVNWLNCLKESLSTFGNDFAVEPIDNLPDSDSIEAVIYIKRAESNQNQDKN